MGRTAVGTDAYRLFGELLGTSHGARRMELHSLQPSQAPQRLGAALARHGGELELLVHGQVDQALAGGGRFEQLAALPRTVYDAEYQHSKLFAAQDVSGGATGAYTNVSLTTHASGRDDVTVELLGDTARAAWRVIDSQRRGASAIVRSAALDDARRAGLLVNEPSLRRTDVTDAHLDAIRSARSSWIEVTKGIEDPAYVDALVAATRRGVRVGVATRAVADSAIGPLRDAGVPVAMLAPREQDMRINLGIADDTVAIARTRYPSPALTGRDSGVLLRDADARTVGSQLDATVSGRLARRMHDVGPIPSATVGRGYGSVLDAVAGSPGRVRHVD